MLLSYNCYGTRYSINSTYYIGHKGVIWVGLSHEQLNRGQDCGNVEGWPPGTLKNVFIVTLFVHIICHCRKSMKCYLWWYFESIVADSSRIVNVGVVNGGQKPHVGRLEWIATGNVNHPYKQYLKTVPLLVNDLC